MEEDRWARFGTRVQLFGLTNACGGMLDFQSIDVAVEDAAFFNYTDSMLAIQVKVSYDCCEQPVKVTLCDVEQDSRWCGIEVTLVSNVLLFASRGIDPGHS
jgi:hypothetical protein